MRRYSSARGAQLFARGVLTYAVRHGYLQAAAVDEKGRFFNIFIAALGFVGRGLNSSTFQLNLSRV